MAVSTNLSFWLNRRVHQTLEPPAATPPHTQTPRADWRTPGSGAWRSQAPPQQGSQLMSTLPSEPKAAADPSPTGGLCLWPPRLLLLALPGVQLLVILFFPSVLQEVESSQTTENNYPTSTWMIYPLPLRWEADHPSATVRLPFRNNCCFYFPADSMCC